MAGERVDKHDRIHHELFDENTNEAGSLGDIVEKHAGDAVFLSPSERSPGGVDAGESDFEVEMNSSDPDEDDDLNPGDSYEKAIYSQSTDQTGTVAGIARGFGTHLPQDLGSGGFHVEGIPQKILRRRLPPPADGEELDDYDDPPNKN